ncbi:SCP2 sterol-binding domain-containing protein [Pilimelia columellifera]|uniref:SCP2 domain-containing protein n=1 Tax=Pilimelia columellifera subsp. columellifera TaxID=706583 RepID=A0ABN3NLX3_9ACTN
MGDITTAFFDELAESDHQPMLRRAQGTIRFDIESGRTTKRWAVTIDRGAVTVSQKNRAADCVVRADGAVFDNLVTGAANTFAMMLRGQVVTDLEHPELLLLFHRFMRARQQAAAATAPPAAAGAGRARSAGRTKR